MKIYVNNVLMQNSPKIEEFFNRSELVTILKENSDNDDTEIKLRSIRDLNALNELVREKNSYIDILEKKSLQEINEYYDEKVYLLNYYLITHLYEYDTFLNFKIYKKFNFEEMMESPDLHQYFFERTFYLNENSNKRHEYSFFPFLISFLRNKQKYTKNDFYRFLRVYNEYAKRMNWVDKKIHHCFDSFSPYLLKNNFSEEDFKWIEEMLFPKEMYQIMDENYDPHHKICEWLDLNEVETQKMQELLKINNTIITGSSLMYLTLRNYEPTSINDIDIWYLDKNKDNSIIEFSKQFQNIIDSPMNYEIKQGIIEILYPEKNKKIQILHVQERDGYSVIKNFDFSCVRGFLGNKKEHLIFTTDFCESIIHKKLFDVYDISNMVRQFTYIIQKRINKYKNRGFELSPYLQSIVEDYEPNHNIDDLLINKKYYNYTSSSKTGNGKIPDKLLNYVYIFSLDNMSHYSSLNLDGFLNIRDLMIVKPSNEVIEQNKNIIETHFCQPYFNKINKHRVIYPPLYRVDLLSDPYIISKIVIIDYQTGEVFPYFKANSVFPIEMILEKSKLDPEKIKYCKHKMLINSTDKNDFFY